MTDYKKISLLVFALLTSLVVSFVFFIKLDQRTHSQTHSLKQPQEYMTEVYLTNFTEEGNLKNTLFAKYWAYLPEEHVSALELPHLTIYKLDNTQWDIDAKHARIKQPTLGTLERITLQEQVVLQRLETPEVTPIRLESKELQYQPNIHYAKTDEFVTITKPGLTMTGLGMRAFLDKGSMEILHDVKTHYSTTQ